VPAADQLVTGVQLPLERDHSVAPRLATPAGVQARERRAADPHRVVPYTLDTSDMGFATAQGFSSGDQFFTYLKDAFDVLYAEGAETPKMPSARVHCRLAGCPARAAALMRFLDYPLTHDRVWICRRVDIARHWIGTHLFRAGREA
jgi:peptidoglycan/xylan/chitin deacetylase (PgdA/CDA1 family)